MGGRGRRHDEVPDNRPSSVLNANLSQEEVDEGSLVDIVKADVLVYQNLDDVVVVPGAPGR